MTIVRKSRWDHATLPYIPRKPCLMYYLIQGDTVPRVVVPNARGEYTQLIPGIPYLEEREEEEDEEEEDEEGSVTSSEDEGGMWSFGGAVLPLLEFAPPPLTEDAATQVEWADLPLPPVAHMRMFDPQEKQ